MATLELCRVTLDALFATKMPDRGKGTGRTCVMPAEIASVTRILDESTREIPGEVDNLPHSTSQCHLRAALVDKRDYAALLLAGAHHRVAVATSGTACIPPQSNAVRFDGAAR